MFVKIVSEKNSDNFNFGRVKVFDFSYLFSFLRKFTLWFTWFFKINFKVFLLENKKNYIEIKQESVLVSIATLFSGNSLFRQRHFEKHFLALLLLGHSDTLFFR